jgi:hypothetical protein
MEIFSPRSLRFGKSSTFIAAAVIPLPPNSPDGL